MCFAAVVGLPSKVARRRGSPRFADLQESCMRSYIGHHQAVSDNDFVELALGTPVELWLGVEGEDEEERAARLAAARDILADDPTLPDRVRQVAAEAIEAYAPELFGVLPLPRRTGRRRPGRNGVAA
jgi:hypothetical protein